MLESRTLRITGAALCLLVVAACGSDETKKTSAEATTTATAGTTTAPPRTAERDREVKNAASRVLRLWARPAVDQNTWWRELRPYLSPQAKKAYAYSDPTQLPTIRLTGSVSLSGDSSTQIAYVNVSTSSGTYAVGMSRTSDDAPWLMERIRLPEGSGS